MKKFLLCIAAGYLIVFLLFLGLVKRAGRMPLKDGTQSTGPKSQAKPVVSKPFLNDLEKVQASPDFKKNPELEKVKNTGPVETFYKSGRLSSEWILDENKNGFLRTYFPDGKLWQEFVFQNGLPQGVWKTFVQDGTLFLDEKFGEGVRDGAMHLYYAGGGALAAFAFNRDVLSGAPQFWSEDSKPAKAPALSSAVSGGYFKAYDEQGREYAHWQQGPDGKAEGKLTAHYLTGATSLEWIWNQTTLDGSAVFFNSQGQKRLEYIFRQGRLAESRSHSDSGALLTQLQTQPNGLIAEGKGFYPGGEIFWTLQRHASEKGQTAYSLKTFWEDQRTIGREKK